MNKVQQEVRKWLLSLASDAWPETFASLAKFSCTKKLSNGAVVRFSITEPDFPKRLKK